MAAISMTYPELAATVLAGVSVLVTVLGVFVALITIWGYTQLKDNAKSAAMKFLEKELQEGKLRQDIEHLVERHLDKSLSAEEFRELLNQRVDRIMFFNDRIRSKDKGLGQTPNENTEYGE